MRRGWPWLLLALLCVGAWIWGTSQSAPSPADDAAPAVAVSAPPGQADAPRTPPPLARQPIALPGFLPPEAFNTITLIQRGGPFPHRQDGGVFGNREGRLPRQRRGWYREYTVDTPGLEHRGARRIVTGGAPPSEWFYTSDHYDSFRRFGPPGASR